MREEELGEYIDYSTKSGVQNRPVFSFFWACWCFYFFFIFLPARVTELGGINPSGFSNPLEPLSPDQLPTFDYLN